MNAARRKELAGVSERIADLIAELEQIGSDEIEAFENLPESIQLGERGDAMQAASDAIEYAKDQLEEANSQLEEAVT